MLFDTIPKISNQFVTQINGFSITIKREDLIHSEVSGNKFRKLKYNIQEAKDQKATALITFGGAFSNHLSATAAAGKQMNIQTHGFVRGEELQFKERNPTLEFCESQGMQLHFISRKAYRLKEQADEVKLFLEKNSGSYVIPEGGTNELAVQGCKEILTPDDHSFSTICCPVGTGGTFSGLVQASTGQEVLGFVVVQDSEIEKTVKRFVESNKKWELLHDHSFGSYGVFPPELISFINHFYQKHEILLDPLYTGKMVFGIFTLIKNNQWRWGKDILIIHTGGIQGIQGANQLLKRQGREIIGC